MRADAPIDAVTAAAYRIPTDGPEADGTISWTSTTMIVVRAHADGQIGTGWTYGAAVARPLINDTLAGVAVGRDAMRRDRRLRRDVPLRPQRGPPRIAAWRYLGTRHRPVGPQGPPPRPPPGPAPRRLPRRVPVYGSGGFTTYHDTHLEPS